MMLTFPAGRVGVALLLLRIYAAIISSCWVAQNLETHVLASVVAGIFGVCLFLGLFTRAAALAICLFSAALVFEEFLPAVDVLQALIFAALGLAGAGAFSLDARIFGRQVIRIRP